MQTVAAQLAEARSALAAVAGAAAGVEARALAAHAWGMAPEALVREAHAAREAASLPQLVARRLKHEPVSQITGKKHFWKDEFLVTRDVLTPRADSETMIETLLRLRPSAPARVLDLGTGSGCLLLSALREYPEAQGVGVDQSDAALEVAAANAAALGLQSRLMLRRSNWCSNVDGLFDVVLANPPYIPLSHKDTLDADVREYEPHSALFAGDDGLDCYREILDASPGAHPVLNHLAPNALVLFEVGMGQAEAVAAMGAAQGLRFIEITKDLAGIGRVVAFEHNR